MKKKKCIKIIAVFLLIISICYIFNLDNNVVYGEVNTIYSTGETAGGIDVDQAVKDSTVLDAIAHFIYAIAGFIEKIVSRLIGYFTGSNIFPWADRVIFNTIPFLDVNFINPASGSMFEAESSSSNGAMTAFGKIVANMYYTIFIIAIAFLGVIVGIMAIKLAISSIAAEKAKYKQAIQNWALALILVFTSHYLISFIFFINEKMVEVASTLLLDQIENVSFTIDVTSWTDEECQHMVNLLAENYRGSPDQISIKNDKFKFNALVKEDFVLLYDIYKEDVPYNDTEDIISLYGMAFLMQNGVQSNLSEQEVEKITNIFNRYVCILLTNGEYVNYHGFYDYATHGKWSDFKHDASNTALDIVSALGGR